MQTNPIYHGLKKSTDSEETNWSCEFNPNRLGVPFSSYSFPPKKIETTKSDDLKIIQNHSPDHQFQTTTFPQNDSNSTTTGFTKPYRSMSAPGVFPLKRRQSNNSPLRKISYSEDSSINDPEFFSTTSPNGNTSWSSTSLNSRNCIDHHLDHKTLLNNRRSSNPGCFTLKHTCQPSPLGIGIETSIGNRSSSNSISSLNSTNSSYFSDVSDINIHSKINPNVKEERNHSNIHHRSTSLDGTQYNNQKDWNTNHHRRPSLSKSIGSFTLKHLNKPSPLSTQIPLSGSIIKGNSHLQTIDDESL
ncbi:hypothetical protein CROQUDRAFT_667917 [Cronartium quercuum f. sp. fusiforme G11]|uniref:Uncharacterized protein n=1 Tax=Cronartium quercuum f. sp. fusiforme G11 TaxID=708437 RepID=A0A9P6TH21_9BASI|nr:hypothetical protein CROQUDRAFT_667917 [Cronartium quercuum f. sp. fusiforme G11]